MLAIVEPQDGQTLTVANGATTFTIAAAIFDLMDVRPGDRLWSGSACMIIRGIDLDSGAGTLLQGWPGPSLASEPAWYIEQSQASRQSLVGSTEMVATANGWLARVLSQATPWAVLDRVAAPPANPAEGDTYLASPAATGSFEPNKIYRSTSGAWVPIAPRKGDSVFVIATRESMGWNGMAWGAGAPPTGSIPTGALADAAVTSAKLADAAVGNAKLADMAVGTIKLRAAGVGSGAPVDGTPAQARAIIQVIDPIPNIIVNGAMQYGQEHGSTSIGVTGTSAWPYVADQTFVGASGSGLAVSTQRVGGMTPGGSGSRIRVSVTTAKASLAGSDYLVVQQPLEAKTLGATRFGTGRARRLLGSFMFKGPAGTYGWRFAGASGTRAWLGTFTIGAAQANADTVQLISVDPETTGAWDLVSAGAGAHFAIVLACGADLVGNVGWNTSLRASTGDQLNGLGSISNVFEVGDLDLYTDVTGTGISRPFVVPDPGTELLRCLRYYEKSHPADKNPGSPTNLFNQYPMPNGGMYATVRFKAQMRATPTVTIYDTAGNIGRITYYDTDWRNGGNYSWILANENALFVQANIVGGLIGCFDFVANARI